MTILAYEMNGEPQDPVLAVELPLSTWRLLYQATGEKQFSIHDDTNYLRLLGAHNDLLHQLTAQLDEMGIGGSSDA